MVGDAGLHRRAGPEAGYSVPAFVAVSVTPGIPASQEAG